MRRFIGSTVALACVCVAAPVTARDDVRVRETTGQWQIDSRRDSFNGRLTCSVHSRNKRMLAHPLAVGLRVVARRDLGAAWLRIDDRQPIAARDLLPELARLGVEIDGRDMNAPTDGWLWIPLDDIGPARMIAVRWAPKTRIRRFDVTGYQAALDVARARGCALRDYVR